MAIFGSFLNIIGHHNCHICCQEWWKTAVRYKHLFFGLCDSLLMGLDQQQQTAVHRVGVNRSKVFGCNITCDTRHLTHDFFFVSVLLSPHIKRFSVSHTLDFCFKQELIWTKYEQFGLIRINLNNWDLIWKTSIHLNQLKWNLNLKLQLRPIGTQ